MHSVIRSIATHLIRRSHSHSLKPTSRFAQGALALSLFLAASVATAATYTVNNINNQGPGSLRQALTDAASGDIINITATGTLILDSELIVNKNLAIQGPGAVNLAISGNGATRVFNIGNATVSISDLSITGGYTGGTGGGLFNRGALTLTGVAIAGNQASYGGGVWNGNDYGSGGSIVFNDCAIKNNTAYTGGGLYNGGSAVVLNNTSVLGNSGGEGLGIHNGNGQLTLNHSKVIGNAMAGSDGMASAGGGITAYGTVKINDSDISYNVAESGGGIFQGGSLTLTNSAVTHNTGGVHGGGIYSQGDMTLVNSTVANNHATSLSCGCLNGALGGGILKGYGALTLINSTISGNVADDSAIAYQSEYAPGEGGGIFVADGATLAMLNSIVAGNISTKTTDISSVAAVIGNSHNFIGSTDGIPNVVGDRTFANTGTTVAQLLAPLAYNGGPTKTFALAVGSLAIDRGDNAATVGTTDQRGEGYVRISRITVDIGAFEAQEVANPSAMVADLKSYVNNLISSNRGMKTALMAKLTDAQIALIAPADIPKACAALQDFINQVRAQRGKKQITAAEADVLIGQAQDIRLLIGCG